MANPHRTQHACQMAFSKSFLKYSTLLLLHNLAKRNWRLTIPVPGKGLTNVVKYDNMDNGETR
jgi:hypothetical protein